MRFLLLVLITLILNSNCNLEDIKSLQKRYNTFQDILYYSNHTISIEKDKDVGIYCRANDYILKGQPVIRVPKEFSISVFDIFPFKHEIHKVLNEITRFGNFKEQKVIFYLEVYNMMYHLYASKEQIRQYIKENKLTDYYIENKVNPKIFESFPPTIPGLATMNNDHLKLLEELGYPSLFKFSEQNVVFQTVNNELMNSPHKSVIIPWISEFNFFMRSQSIISSRMLSFRFQEYQQLEPFTPEEIAQNKEAIEKNRLLNFDISKNFPGFGIIAYIDLCNHYQPKKADLADITPIVLSTEKGHFINVAGRNFRMNDEYAFTYVRDLNNQGLAGSYGFIIKDNLFNKFDAIINDNDKLEQIKTALAIETGSLDSSVKNQESPIKNKKLSLTNYKLDKSVLILGRIKALNKNFDYKTSLKSLLKDIPISHNNEINALKYYYKIISFLIKQRSSIVENNLAEAQYFRDRIRHLSNEWRHEPSQLKEKEILENYKLIYEMDISYNIILYKNINLSLDEIIARINKELNIFRNKYLN